MDIMGHQQESWFLRHPMHHTLTKEESVSTVEQFKLHFGEEMGQDTIFVMHVACITR